MGKVVSARERAAEIRASDGGSHALIVVVPIPPNLARYFPAGKYPPHVTLNYVGDDASPYECSTVVTLVREVCRATPSFRCALDANRGLKDFGPNESGEKALWFAVREEPEGSLARLHSAIKQKLAFEGFETDDFDDFVPHCTWDYVPNDQTEADRIEASRYASARMDQANSLWFDVTAVQVGLPSGAYKTAVLKLVK